MDAVFGGRVHGCNLCRRAIAVVFVYVRVSDAIVQPKQSLRARCHRDGDVAVSTRTAADPHALWLQMGRYRLEQALQSGVPSDSCEGQLTLESVNDGPTANASGLADGQVDRRTTTDRRVVYDRRQLIRFEDDRRAGVDRRTGNDSLEMS